MSRATPSPHVAPAALAVLLVGALAGEGARAQAVLRTHEIDQVRFNRADCDDDAEIVLEIEATSLVDTAYFLSERLVEPGGVQQGTIICPDVDLEPLRQVVPERTIAPVGGRIFEQIELVPSEVIGAGACDEDGERRTDVALCLYLLDSARNEVFADGIAITYDTAVPAAPTLTDVQAGDGRVSFTVAGGDTGAGDDLDYLVQYRPCEALDASPADGGAGDAGAVDAGSAVAAESICDSPYDFEEDRFEDADVELTGLENDVEYEIRARVQDDFDNTGAPSEAVLATPRPELAPLDLYDGAGSPFSCAPSCGSVTGDPFALGLLALGLVLVRRRRRVKNRGAASALLAVALVSSAGARAEPGDFTFGLRVGPYAPALDEEQAGGQPIFPIYECFFDDKLLAEFGADGGVVLFDAFGSLELVLGASFAYARGKAQPVTALNPATVSRGECLEPASGDVELSILKVRPGITYRLDPLLDAYGFPLVPYVRAGLVATGYAFTREGLFDETTQSAAADPVGLVFGYEGAFGLQLALDFFDPVDPFTPYAARRAQANEIYKHAFVFAEVVYQELDNFGQPGFIFSPQGRLLGTGAPVVAQFGVSVEFP